MSILLAFETFSLVPFCSSKEKDIFMNMLPNQEAKINFLKGNQINLRAALSNEFKRFADAIEVVSF